MTNFRWFTLPAGLIVGAGVLAATIPASAETRRYDFTGFKRIDSSAGVEVIVKQGPFSIEASESGGDFDQLRIELEGDRLEISRRNLNSFWSRRSYTVTVSAPGFEGFEASSGSSIEARNIEAGDLSLAASSGADLEITGRCGALRVEASSGADIDAASLKCREVSADASSGSDIEAYASERATAEASSGADIDIFGPVQNPTSKKSSGGDVSFRG